MHVATSTFSKRAKSVSVLFYLLVLHSESIHPSYFAPCREPQNRWTEDRDVGCKSVHVRARTDTIVHAYIPSLWRGSLKRTGFAGEHIPYTLTRALSCLSYASIPGMVSGRIDLRAWLSGVELPPSPPPLTLSFSLALSKISKSMTRRERARTVLFEQRVTFLAWRFPIEMLMKSDDSWTSRNAVIRDGDVGDVAILSQLLTADCAPSRFLTIANFASSNYTWGSHCIFAEQARAYTEFKLINF